MIEILLNTIIPKNNELNMPSAAKINFPKYQKKYNAINITNNFVYELNNISLSNFKKEFIELDENSRIKCLGLLRIKKIRLFTTFINHVFKAYYTDPIVLSSLDSYSEENLKKDNWQILTPVVKRGIIYKRTKELL